MRAALLLALAMGCAVEQPWGPELEAGSSHIVLGLPGDGKTTHAERLTSGAFRVLFATPEPEDYAGPGRLELRGASQLTPAVLNDPHLRAVVRLRGDSDKELAGEVREVIRRIFPPVGPGRMVAVFDELGDYSLNAAQPRKVLKRPSRKHGIVPLLVSQVATDIPLTCRRVVSRVHCFGQHHQQELDALEKCYGAEFVQQVANWQRHDAAGSWNPPVVWNRKV